MEDLLAAQGLLRMIDADAEMEEVTHRLEAALTERSGEGGRIAHPAEGWQAAGLALWATSSHQGVAYTDADLATRSASSPWPHASWNITPPPPAPFAPGCTASAAQGLAALVAMLASGSVFGGRHTPLQLFARFFHFLGRYDTAEKRRHLADVLRVYGAALPEGPPLDTFAAFMQQASYITLVSVGAYIAISGHDLTMGALIASSIRSDRCW